MLQERPEKIGRVRGLEETLRLQDRVADKMRGHRHELGALDLETIEARPVIRDGMIEKDYKPVLLRHRILAPKIWVESIGAGGGGRVLHICLGAAGRVSLDGPPDRSDLIGGRLDAVRVVIEGEPHGGSVVGRAGYRIRLQLDGGA